MNLPLSLLIGSSAPTPWLFVRHNIIRRLNALILSGYASLLSGYTSVFDLDHAIRIRNRAGIVRDRKDATVAV
jgi:hypothetical protein